MAEHRELTFDACVALAAENPDFAFCGDELPVLKEVFKQWASLLLYEEFEAGRDRYICVYFPAVIETEIADAFRANPVLGWGMHSLAWSMLRLHTRLKLGEHSCLPLPQLTDDLQKELCRLGLCADGHLTRTFALLTFFPIKSNCSRCALQKDCSAQRFT